MNSIFLNNRNQSGFTLLEVIITLIVASILGAILYQFMGTSLTQSSVSVVRVQDEFELNAVMEKMTAHYRDFVKTGTITLADFKTDIETDDPYPGGSYGVYTVEFSGYIKFNTDGDEINGGTSILKATIKKGEQTLTTLFTK